VIKEQLLMKTITMVEACKLADENPLGSPSLYSDYFNEFAELESPALWSALRAGDAYIFEDGDVRFSVEIAGTKQAWVVTP
jgi:hypothetical protein